MQGAIEMRTSRKRSLASAVFVAALVVTVPAPAVATHPPVEAGLPDIGMLPPTDFSIQSRPRGQRWLRFDTVIVNIGPGPFQVYGHDDLTDATSKHAVVQEVWDGTSWAEQPTEAVMSYSGDGHDHWHVENLQDWTIVNANDAAARVLAKGAKTGFCFWDNYRYGSTASPHYHPYTTDACELMGDGTVPMGLAVGWGDEYPSTIAYQYIDISGLPNGDYVVTVVADPQNWFIEASDANNSSWTKIRISRKNVQVLEYGPRP
jgi:hypothetical protein